MDPYQGVKYAAPNTTNKILKRLIKEKKVIDRVDRDGRSHHLYINDKNKFIMINQLLSKMHIMLDKIDKQKLESKSSSTALLCITNYSPGFKQVCDDALRSLLINTDKIIPVEGDCNKLYLRIIKVLKELDSAFYEPSKNIRTAANVIDKSGKILTVSVGHGDQSNRFTVESRADIGIVENLIASILNK